MSQPVISNIIKGAREARAGDLARIADAVGLPPSALMPPPGARARVKMLERLALEGTVNAGRQIVEIGLQIMVQAAGEFRD